LSKTGYISTEGEPYIYGHECKEGRDRALIYVPAGAFSSHNAPMHGAHHTGAKFIVPHCRDKLDSGIGLSYLARQATQSGGSVYDNPICWSQLIPPVRDYEYGYGTYQDFRSIIQKSFFLDPSLLVKKRTDLRPRQRQKRPQKIRTDTSAPF
jgi:hypothetical protein